MSTVNSTPSTNDLIKTLNGSNGSSASKSKTAQDLQDSFLTMLTTQLQNQDPLNPMDNAQMTSQLAQISMLEGIQGLNTTLTTLLSSYNTSQALQAAGGYRLQRAGRGQSPGADQRSGTGRSNTGQFSHLASSSPSRTAPARPCRPRSWASSQPAPSPSSGTARTPTERKCPTATTASRWRRAPVAPR